MTTSPTKPGAADNLTDIELAVGGMTCASCSSRVERHLNKIAGAHAEVNLVTETASVRFDPEQCDPQQLVSAVERAGYTAEVVDHSHGGHDHMNHDDGSPLRLVVATVCSVPVVAVSMFSALQFPYWQWLAGALATVVALWAGASFHRAGFSALKIGEAGMDSLISIGSLAAWGYSVVALIFLGAGGAREHMTMSLTASSGEHPVYFEVAAGVITLILLGRYLEARARRRAGDAVRALLNLQPAEARVMRDGVEQTIAAHDLQAGDMFVVRAGERIPTDGVIADGLSTIDTSMVTGESLPITRRARERGHRRHNEPHRSHRSSCHTSWNRHHARADCRPRAHSAEWQGADPATCRPRLGGVCSRCDLMRDRHARILDRPWLVVRSRIQYCRRGADRRVPVRHGARQRRLRSWPAPGAARSWVS